MNADDPDDAVVSAFRRRREARAALSEALEGLSPMAMEAVTSMVEEYGPAKTQEQLQTAPEAIQRYHPKFKSDKERQRAEAALLKFAETNDNLDRAVGAREAARANPSPYERRFAFQGKLALVNTQSDTFIYLATLGNPRAAMHQYQLARQANAGMVPIRRNEVDAMLALHEDLMLRAIAYVEKALP